MSDITAQEVTAIATLPPAERAAIVLKSAKLETELRALVASSADITAVVDDNGREQVHRIGMTLRNSRTGIQKDGKAARDDATKYSKAVIAEEDRLIAIIEPEEKRVLALRDAWDAEQERINQAKVAAERARTEAHEANLAAIFRIPATVAGRPSIEIALALETWTDYTPGEEWEEFRHKAAAAYAEIVDTLTGMHKAALAAEEKAAAEQAAREAEAKRVADEAAALARQKAEQEAEAARLASVAAENKRQADELAAQREAFAAEQRAAQQAKDDAARVEVEQAVALENDRASSYNDGAVDETVIGLPTQPPAEFVESPSGMFEIMYKDRSAEAPPTLSLGKISARLKFTVTCEFLASMGFAPAATVKASKLFHERDFPSICAAIIRHVEAVVAQEKDNQNG